MARSELVRSAGEKSPAARQDAVAAESGELEEPPVYDRGAVERAYNYHRARRIARIRQRREHKLARLRFWFVAAGLLLLCLVIGVTIWGQVQRLFGL